MNETHPQGCVSPFAVVTGLHSVHFSIGCVVHPFAVIVAQNGPIYFGAYCVVEEHACIMNSAGNDDVGEELIQVGTAPRSMSIGPYNHFKAFSHVANISRIGHGNCFETHSYVEGPRERVGNSSALNCIGDYSLIGAFVHISMHDCGGQTKVEDAAVSCASLIIPSRMVFVPFTTTEEYCDHYASSRTTCSSFSHCWMLPRGEQFDVEVEEEILRKKCFYLREVVEK